MNLSPAAFNAHIQRMGQDVFWRKAWACACVNPHSGSADTQCQVCDALGWIWDDERPARIGLQAMSSRKSMQTFGVYEEGDILASIGSDSPVYAIGRFDRIRSRVASNPFSFHLQRGMNDRVMGTVVSIDRVFWLNEAKTETIDGTPPTIGCNGALSWPVGQGPPEGAVYSISGVRYDEWYAFPNLSADRMIHNAKLPRKILLRRFDLFGRAEGR